MTSGRLDIKHVSRSAAPARGSPELLLADRVEPAWYAEWLDSFYARDIQALFGSGWERLRDEDRGGLWEHLVLNTLRTAMEPARTVSFWRDKSGREVDFVVARGRDVDAFECKIRPDRVDPRNLDAFRDAYPRGRNFVVSPFVDEAYDFRIGTHAVRAIGCADLMLPECLR